MAEVKKTVARKSKEIERAKAFSDKITNKKAYDYALTVEFANKVKEKMRFSLEVSAINGKKLTKNEQEAILFGFNSAIQHCGKAINEVLIEYSQK